MSYEVFREQCAKIVAAWGYPILAGTIRALPLLGVTQEPLAWLIKDIGMVTTSKAERDRWIEAGRDVVELVDIQPDAEELRKENEQLKLMLNKDVSQLVNDTLASLLDASEEDNKKLRERIAELESKPVLAPDHNGMRVDYSGLLGQSEMAIKLSEPGNAEMLRQFKGHIEELGKRYYAGDVAVVDEFLQLYCVEHEARCALKGGAA